MGDAMSRFEVPEYVPDFKEVEILGDSPYSIEP
jgi:hypothetical protein